MTYMFSILLFYNNNASTCVNYRKVIILPYFCRGISGRHIYQCIFSCINGFIDSSYTKHCISHRIIRFVNTNANGYIAPIIDKNPSCINSLIRKNRWYCYCRTSYINRGIEFYSIGKFSKFLLMAANV